ncbi:MAG: iron ABC transporter permease, partial [Candidatus Methanomethylophilus sp.]|nr:iron ABC transporter permease [Methanomethylophilus sp.]
RPAGVSTNWAEIQVMTVIVVIGIIVIQFLSRKINLLATGDDNAKAMGVQAEQLRIICLFVVALISAGVVSFTGLTGFVGLVAPHVVRIFIGADNRYLVPASAAFGASLLVLSYAISIWLIEPITLQVGVITSFLGGPLFLWLIVRRKSNVW